VVFGKIILQKHGVESNRDGDSQNRFPLLGVARHASPDAPGLHKVHALLAVAFKVYWIYMRIQNMANVWQDTVGRNRNMKDKIAYGYF